MKRHKVFSNLIKNKKESNNLVMTSVLIAVGVNLFSTGMVELFGFPYKEMVLIVLGGILSLGIIGRSAWSKIKELNQSIKFDGFIIYDKNNHNILSVPEYDISMDMTKFLKSAFSENKAMEKIWNEESIGQFRIVGGKPGEHALGIATHSGAMFIELLEYCLIQKLSSHLSSYFNNSYEKPQIHTFDKQDIPHVLLSNRFLKLFSEDMINREIFACTGNQIGNNEEKGKIVCAMNASGGYYHSFDLILPEKSQVIRKSKNEIVIETPILTLTLSCLFGGFSTVLKQGFSKYYLGLTPKQRAALDVYQFNVEVSVKFKYRSLLSKDKEIYYSWIDSFLDEIAKYLEKEEFFQKINWDTVSALIRCANNMNTTNNCTVE